MKKIIFTLFGFIITLSTVNAQKGINFSLTFPAGGRLLMCVDSSAKNVYYVNKFSNQPNTSFSYLPEINNVSIQIYFRKKDNVQDYRYTILADDKPIVVNKSINQEQLKDVVRKDHEFKDEVFGSTSLGVFPIKGKAITTLVYSIERPLHIQKSVLYGKPIPRAKIRLLAKRFATDKGVDYDHIIEPKESTNITFNEKDDELTIVNDGLDIDYLYGISIKDQRTNKIVFESTAWQYGGYIDDIDGYDVLLPYVKIDKSVFKKSGDYEVVIQPLIKWDKCIDCDISPKEIEKYKARYTLAITLDEESYTKKEAFTYTFTVV